ncbi:9935_t:CDS:10 [Entrophospora sp. SA101]|nr:9935_t:CDS:10 [Entrophospora sp. SA101]
MDNYLSPVGFNCYLWCGREEGAGNSLQSVPHFHINLVPIYQKEYGLNWFSTRIKRENGAELAPTPQEYQETAEEFKPNPERIIKETNKLIVELASAEEALIPGHLIINQIGESLQECLREIKEKFAVKNIQVEFPLGKLSGPEQQNVSELQLHILPFQEENYSYKNPEQKSREYLRIARELKGVVMEEKVVREQQAQIIQQGTIIPSPENSLTHHDYKINPIRTSARAKKVRFEKLPGAANKRAMKTSFVFDALGPGDYERLVKDLEKQLKAAIETAGKEGKEKAIQNKEALKKELTQKTKIIVSLLAKEFLISNFAKNQVVLDSNSSLNHLKNVYVDLTKIDLYYLFKDIEERIKFIEKLTSEIANHGTQPFNSLTTPPLTLKNIEAITTTNSYLLKLTLAENIQYHDEVSNIMYFLPFAEDAENKHEPDAEAFFYFITKLNQSIQIPIRPGLKIDDYNFASYLKQNNITPNQYTNYKENKTPQEQLDYFFDKSQVEIINLKYLNFKQPSELIIDNYPELKEIRGEYILNLTHQLTTLDLSNCDNLERIDCSNNQLTQIKLPKGEKLKMLHLSNNNLSQDLFFLSGLVGLKELRLENNPFYGSLEPLKGMSKLEKLDISYTDIDSGLEYLPDSLEKFDCSANTRKDAKVKAIEEKLEPCGGTIQEKQINYLEIRVQELVNLIKNQKEKIALAYTHFCSEKETLQKLIKLNLEFTQFKERETNSPNYDEKSEEYEEQINELKKQLRSKLTKENMNEVRLIIKDCEELVSWELELEAKTNGKIALEFTKESQTIHILGNVNVVQGGHALIGCKLENNVDLSYNKLIELPEENNPKREKRDNTKNLTPEQVLNHSDLNALKQEYQATQQQVQILHKPYGIPISSEKKIEIDTDDDYISFFSNEKDKTKDAEQLKTEKKNDINTEPIPTEWQSIFKKENKSQTGRENAKEVKLDKQQEIKYEPMEIDEANQQHNNYSQRKLTRGNFRSYLRQNAKKGQHWCSHCQRVGYYNGKGYSDYCIDHICEEEGCENYCKQGEDLFVSSPTGGSNEHGKFKINLLVCDPKENDPLRIKVFSKSSNLEEAMNRVRLIKDDLEGDIPILALLREGGEKIFLSKIIKEVRLEIRGNAVNKPDKCIKNHDIISVEMDGRCGLKHAAVYLANKKVAHISAEELTLYRPLIPFKFPSLIEEHINTTVNMKYRLDKNSEQILSHEEIQELREEYKEFSEEVKNGSKISTEAIMLIKSFNNNFIGSEIPNNYRDLMTKEQKSLIEKLIPSKELKEQCSNYGLCRICCQPNIGRHIFVNTDVPETKNYIMVMEYIVHGDLRKYLKVYSSQDLLSFGGKINQLENIISGLNFIHKKGLMHRDLHAGNILNRHMTCFITDLGLCRPANETDKSKVFGILPYVAPEVLTEKKYTQAADVYSFGIVATEILTALPPYSRPTTNEILNNLIGWHEEDENSEFSQQAKKAEEFNRTLPEHIKHPNYKEHLEAVRRSKALDFENLPNPQNSQETKKVLSQSGEINKEINEVKSKISLLKKPLDDELTQLVEKFVETKKKSIKDEKDERARNEIKGLNKKLRERGFSREKIGEIIRYCESLVDLEQKQIKEAQAEAKIIETPPKNNY